MGVGRVTSRSARRRVTKCSSANQKGNLANHPATAWCKRMEIADRWVEIDAAVDVLGLLVEESVPPVVHVTCPACYAGVAAGGG